MSMKKGRIIITNPKRFAEQIKEIKRQGKKNLRFVCDFDRTLSQCFVAGKKMPSLIGILREESYLSANYVKEAYTLLNRYQPIELNPNLSLSFKKKMMELWWRKHFALLIKEELTKDLVYQAISRSPFKLRAGGREFFQQLNKQRVPLIIFSAGGLGELSIEIFLRKRALLLANVLIVANSFYFKPDGRLKKIKEPIIHSYNKDETIIRQYDFYDRIKERRNLVIIGDSLADASMHKGFKYNQLLKIGFLNEKEEINLNPYRQAFDVLILGDSSFYHINQILKKILR